jgi:hypothetical protein
MVFGLGRNNGADEGKYLTIESVGEGKKITEINILMVQKFFEQYLPNLAESRRMRDGRILVLTGNKNEAERAMNITNFYNILTIAIKPFEPMNNSMGSIFGRELLTLTTEEMDAALQDQGVVKVERIEGWDREEKIYKPNGLHILTFSRRNLPENVRIGYCQLKVNTYYPNPLRCSRCCVYGHTKKNCKETVDFCKDCGEIKHPDSNCDVKRCRNCNAAHSSFDRQCPVRVKEDAITRMKVEERISYGMARNKFMNEVKKTISYADTIRMAIENEAARNSHHLSELKEQREQAEHILDEIREETKQLEALAIEIREAKKRRDMLTAFVSMNENDEPLEITDDDEEQMDAETSNEQKRSRASDSENESNSYKKKHTTKPCMKNEKNERPLTKEQFEVLTPKAKQKIAKVLRNAPVPTAFVVKNGQVIHRKAADPENPRYSDFKHFVLSKRSNI